MTRRLEAAVIASVTLLAVTLAGACYRTELEPLGLIGTDGAENAEVSDIDDMGWELDGDFIESEHDLQPDPSPDDPGLDDSVEEADEEADLYDAEEQGPSIVWLSWDDGTCEGHSVPGDDWYPGGMIAVCFTPPSYPCRLVSATFLVFDAGYPDTEFGVRLYRGNGINFQPRTLIPIPTTTAHAGPEGGWVEVDLSEAGVTIDSGDFCVAMEWLTLAGEDIYDPDAQALCHDEDTPYQGRSWIYWASERLWYSLDNAGMIRALVEVD
jgi:hypothetical protein